ncbi:hypothetical protein AAWM_09835 [Aspergillus awamori]|uniref:Uncharacterized protein n=1 Tax=Aspergillus awamori TaxID=105351 RepID=A0A401L641_ASPAW|nr:hypothetical protein AAWM_09835 [Aspergillus awamori]
MSSEGRCEYTVAQYPNKPSDKPLKASHTSFGSATEPFSVDLALILKDKTKTKDAWDLDAAAPQDAIELASVRLILEANAWIW